MRSKMPILLLSAVLTSLLAVLVMKLGSRGSAGPSNSDAPRPAPVADEGDQRRPSSVTERRSSPGLRRQAPNLPPPATPSGAATVVPVQEKSPEQFSQEVEEAFAADGAADATSAQMQTGIAEAFRKPGAAGAVLRNVDGHRTRCRLTLDIADQAADKRVFSDIFNLLGSAGVDTDKLGFIVPTRTVRDDGSVAAIVHLYRVPSTI